MAGLACDLLMLPYERKARLLRMIESPQGPAVRVVAARASPSEPPLVEILVTAFASGGRVLVSLGAVALLARDRFVQADQGKPGELVVERKILPPARVVVAPLTALPQLPLVRVLLPMT